MVLWATVQQRTKKKKKKCLLFLGYLYLYNWPPAFMLHWVMSTQAPAAFLTWFAGQMHAPSHSSGSHGGNGFAHVDSHVLPHALHTFGASQSQPVPLQGSSFNVAPHSAPPLLAGVTVARVNSLPPRPQLTEHGVMALQSDMTQSCLHACVLQGVYFRRTAHTTDDDEELVVLESSGLCSDCCQPPPQAAVHSPTLVQLP